MTIELVQGSPEWFAARLGRVTASRISDMLARTKTGWGAGRANYAAQLVAERLTGEPGETFESAEMRRGRDVEPEARAAYAFYADAEITEVGFVPHPTIEMSGASPDGLVGSDGIVQFKCPNTAGHIETILGASIPKRYRDQMQWELACTKRKWCDLASFDPRLPERMRLFVQRVHRDVALIAEVEREINVFLAEVAGQVAALEAHFAPRAVAA